MAWNALALPALALGPVTIVAAWLIYRARPRHALNRLLALALLTQGMGTFLSYGVRPQVDGMQLAVALHRTSLPIVFLAATLLALAATYFPHGLPAAMQGRWFRGTLAAVGGAICVAATLAPERYAASYQFDATVASWKGGDFGVLYGISMAFSIVAIVVAGTASWRAARRTDTPLLRAKYRWIWRAMLANVIGQAGPLTLLFIFDYALQTGETFTARLNFVGFPIGALLFTIMAAYGFSKAESLRGEVQAKRLIRRGGLAAIGIPALIIAYQVGTEVVSETLGIVAGGIVMALLLAIALPAQAWLNRATAHLGPGSTEDQYWGERKRRIYEAALEGALADGWVSPREEQMLTNLQLELGVSNKEAAEIRSGMTA